MQERSHAPGLLTPDQRGGRPGSVGEAQTVARDREVNVSAPATRPRFWLAALAVLLCAAAGAWAWQHPEMLKGLSASTSRDTGQARNADTQVSIPIHATTVGRRDVPIYLSGLGTAQAWNSVTVRSRVDGQVEKILFEEGQPVKAGDILVELDARPFRAALDQAEAKIVQDQANLASADADLKRTQALVTPGYATKQLLDQQTGAVNQVKALIKADEAARDNAKVNLSYATIRAPIDGRLGLRSIDIGNIVHATDQNGIVTIAEIQPIAVVFTAPEDELPAITRGLKDGALELVAFSSDGKMELGRGTLAIVNNDIDIASGTIRLKGRFDNADSLLWPGLSVTTRLLVTTLRNQVVVPDIAVQRGPAGLFAYVVRADQTVETRDLKIGPISDGVAVIESGVQPGEQVVTAGHARLQPGTHVTATMDGADHSTNKN